MPASTRTTAQVLEAYHSYGVTRLDMPEHSANQNIDIAWMMVFMAVVMAALLDT